jgi:excisionase family DNA binding protein
MDALLTKADVARITRRSVSAIDKAVSARKLPFVKIQRHVRFRPSDIEAWIAAQVVQAISVTSPHEKT